MTIKPEYLKELSTLVIDYRSWVYGINRECAMGAGTVLAIAEFFHGLPQEDIKAVFMQLYNSGCGGLTSRPVMLPYGVERSELKEGDFMCASMPAIDSLTALAHLAVALVEEQEMKKLAEQRGD